MAPKAGLSYNNDPFLTGAVSGVSADPFLPTAPSMPASSPTGVGSLGSSAADQAALAGGFLSRSRASLADLMAPPQRAPTPVIGVSAAGDELYVQGRRFTADDAQAALEAEATLSGAPVGQLPAGFRQLDPGTYAQYTQIIRNPSRGELFSKGFGRGIDSLQMLAGRGAQLLGAEEFGGRTVAQQVEDLRKTEPYARQFTDIQSGDDAIDWFVATLGEQGPMLLESVGAGLAGAVAGGFTGGPLAAAGGAVAGLVGKTAWKNSVLAAARKRAAGEVLDAAQAKLLRNAAAITGATAANVANSMALGASDIYGELRDQGADADDVGARLTAVAGSLPYAFLDLLPEFALASRLFGAGGRAAIAAGTSLPRRGAELLRRVGTGTAVGGAAEGATEAGQEALLLGLSDQDFSKPENVQRLINSFAAGFAVGGPLGGLANLKGKKAADVLQGGNPDQMLALPAPPLALPAPEAPPTLALPAPQGRLPDYSAPEGELPLTGGTGVAPLPTVGAAPTQGEMFPVAGLGEAPVAGTDQQMELPFAQGTERPQIQDVLPLETGLPPRFFAQPAAPTGTLADNPVLRAMQQRAEAAPVTAERQAAFDAAQQAVAAQQEAARVPTVELRRGQTLQQIQPELLAAETAILSPELGTTPEQATTAWNTLATGPGRRKAFDKFLPEIQAQWIDALNMASVGELTEDDLRTIRVELVQAENAARLTKTAPVTVVTGAITPTPTPPKGGKLRAAKKPEAAKVPPAKQPGASGEALKRPAGGRGTAGASTAKSEAKAETKVEPVPAKPREVVPPVKAAVPAPKKTRRSPKEERDLLPTFGEQVDSAIDYVETGKSKADIEEAVYDLVEVAYFSEPGTGAAAKNATDKARAFIEVTFPEDGVGKTIEDQFVELANSLAKSEELSASSKDGSPRPWLQFAVDNDLVSSITTGRGNVSDIARLKDDAIREAATEAFAVKVEPAQTKAPKPDSKLLASNVSLSKVTALINGNLKTSSLDKPFTFSQAGSGRETYANLPAALEQFYTTVNEADRDAIVNGYPLRSYFTADGKANMQPVAEVFGKPIYSVVSTEKPGSTPVEAPRLEREAAEVGKLVDKTLTTEEKQTAAEAYDETEYNGTVRENLVNDTIATIKQPSRLDSLKAALRPIIRKLVVAVVAFTVVVNPIGTSRFSAANAATLNQVASATETSQVRKSVPTAARPSMSDRAIGVYETVAPGAIRTGKGFIIADKPAGMVHIFDKNGKHLSSTSALFGKDTGDTIVNTKEAVAGSKTPAGKFRLMRIARGGYEGGVLYALVNPETGGLVWSQAPTGGAAFVAMHGIVQATGQNRLGRITNADATDNKISTGCINTMKSVIVDVMEANADQMDGGALFVLPDETAATGKTFATSTTTTTTTTTGKTATATQQPKQIGRVERLLTPPAPEGRFKLSDFNTPDRPDPAVGKLRMAITRFTSRLVTKPKMSVFRNQADMKAKNPKLYQQAIASRPEGDFATAEAAGFSFGDGNVVIFTDRIANEQHLNFVLAHETIGHFGLRGIIPAAQFNAVMDAIYNASPAIKADVDVAVANGMPRAEAVEEYLSDFAAVLDTSVVARVWNAIKGALNKLGVKFGDEMVRYTLKHARSYVRTGKPSIFDAAKVFGDLYDTEHGLGYVSTGRFSTVGDLYSDNQSAELVRDTVGGTPTDFEAAWGAIKGLTGDNIDRFDRLKAEFLSLANFRSRLNPGLNRLEEVLEAARNLTSSIRVSSNERNAEVFNTAVFGKYFGTTDEQTAMISKLMYDAQRLAVSKITDLRTLKGTPLYDFKDGVLTPNQPEIDKLTKQGMVTLAQARDGFSYTVPLPDGTMRTEKFAGIPGLTEDSIEWRGYTSLRATVNDVELQLLRARYQSLFEDQKIAFKQFDELVETKRLTSAERELLRRIIKTYKDIYTADITFDERGYPRLNADAMGSGNDFIIAVNKTLIPAGGKDSDFAAVATFFEGKAADDIVAQLRAFRARLKLGEGNKFTIQNRIKQILMLEVSNSDADLYTRRTLATGYTPLLREGQFQVRVEATNPRTGKIVRLADAYRERLIYSQVEAQSEAEGIAKGINDIFGDKTYEVEAYSPDANEFTMQTVVLRAVPETSLDAIAGPPELNLNEFTYGLRQLDITLTPKEVEKVVTALTRQNSTARNRLLRAFTPGADPDAIRAVSRHIDSRASTISKVIMRPQLGELMNLSMESTQRLWNGDAKLLADLKAMSEDTNLTPDERALATREYERYRFMYEQTNPAGKPKRANQFYNEASRTVAFLDDNRSVTESNFETGKIAARVRATTSIMQLGGSIATGALNLISAYTNGLPFLASYNPSNGFGGGFGMGPSVAAFHVAMGQVGALGMTNLKANTAEFYDAITKSTDLQARYGLKAHEAAFIAQEIREGAMIPAQTNALLNTARGQTSSGFLRKFIDGWMLPFNLTEQASRRTLGLAAYRLEYNRQTSAGVSDKKASESARRFAVEALNLTMGEYSVLNRPPAWRSGIQSFLYMYKVFPTTSIQLFSNLSRNGKIAMLASLWMLSGLQGLPFAEDLEDLIDTLAQALGFKSGSIRMEIAKFLDGIFPGMSPFFMQGLVNRAVPADIGGRVSLGNVIPGSGILLAGADVGRELTDIAGPAPSALIGSAGFLANLMRVPFSERVSLVDLARESPVTMMRAVGDTVAYAKADAIVNRKGSIVDEDIGAGVLAARLLGFYPAAAAEQYSVIRIGNRVTDYQRDVVAGFRAAWVKAKIEGDNAGAREIESAVDEWNKGAKGTGLQIADFRGRSARALKEAKRPAKERTLRTVPKAGREDIERTFDILSY